MQLTNLKVADLSRQAADLFHENGGDLNQAVAKVAAMHELTPMQIQRVVESANHEVNQRIYKTATDRRFTFKLASRDAVLALLGSGKDKPAEKTAGEDDFFTLSADRKGMQTAKLASAPTEKFGSAYRAGESAAKLAALNTLQLCVAKLTSYSRDLRLQKNALDYSRETNFGRLVKEARRLMLEDGIPFADMVSGACQSVHPELAKAIMTDAHARLSKIASSAEKKLLKDLGSTEGMRLINGNQPLFIHLRATAGDAALGECLGCYATAVNQCLAGVVTAIHELNSTDATRSYIENEVQPFANNVQRGLKFAMEYVLDHGNDNTWLAKTANWGPIVAMLDKIGRVFQFINQGGQAVESVGRNTKQILQDMFSPAVFQGGTVLPTAGVKS